MPSDENDLGELQAGLFHLQAMIRSDNTCYHRHGSSELASSDVFCSVSTAVGNERMLSPYPNIVDTNFWFGTQVLKDVKNGSIMGPVGRLYTLKMADDYVAGCQKGAGMSS